QRAGQHWQYERFTVPERVPVVTRTGQALGRDRTVFAARACLEYVEQSEAHGLLDLRIGVELHIDIAPEVLEVLVLLAEQAVPPNVPRANNRREHLVEQCAAGAPTRPAIREKLDQAHSFARPERRRQRDAAGIRTTVNLGLHARRTL